MILISEFTDQNNLRTGLADLWTLPPLAGGHVDAPLLPSLQSHQMVEVHWWVKPQHRRTSCKLPTCCIVPVWLSAAGVEELM